MRKDEMKTPPMEFETRHTSKGNQLKWKQDGYWYKADQFGYEGVAETIVSAFFKKLVVPFAFVSYERVKIVCEGKEYTGCRSRDFYEEDPALQGYVLIPLERLHRQYTGEGLAKHLAKFREVADRVSYTTDFVRNVTGLSRFDDYLTFMIQTDAFFLNEDRHTNNIAVLWSPETDVYEYCPYFDFGLSLFADTKEDFPLSMDFAACRKVIKAKPFSVDFDEQLDVCEKIGANELRFPFRCGEMRKEAEAALANIECEESFKKRVIETLAYQANRYQYMFRIVRLKA